MSVFWDRLSRVGETSVAGSELLPLCRLVVTIAVVNDLVSACKSNGDAGA